MNKVLPDQIYFPTYFDKFVHFIMYFTLSFIFFMENFNYKYAIKKYWIIIATISVGIILELLQFLLANNREANIYDAIFNSIGVITGAALSTILKDFPLVYKLMLFKKIYKR